MEPGNIINLPNAGEPCSVCGINPGLSLPNPISPGTMWHFPCESCAAEIELKAQNLANSELMEQRREKYEATIPPIYRESDPGRFPDTWERIKDWTPANDGRGLILVGDTGKCKTRMMAEIARRLIMVDGINCRLLRASTFADIVRRQFSNDDALGARKELRELQMVRVLIIDDIGKQATSPSIEEAVFELIEERITNKRPMLITANATGAEIENMMSNDRGRPLVRRLREFCEAHSVK